MREVLTNATLMLENLIHCGFVIGNAFDVLKMFVDMSVAGFYDFYVVAAFLSDCIANADDLFLSGYLFG